MKHLDSFLRTSATLAVLALVSACTTVFEGDKVNYKTDGAQKVAPLDIPPDLTQLTRDTRYAVPSASVSANSMGTRAAPMVAAVAANQVNDVRLERDGQQRWLVVDRSAESVWPIVNAFWKENGFTYTIEQQQLGLLETDWAENRAKIPQDFIRRTLGKLLDGLYSTGERDKFRTRIERNSKGGVDIFITHRGMSEEYRDQSKTGTIWQPRPSDPQLEAEFLSRLMVKLGVSLEQANASTANASQPVQEKLLTKTTNGVTSLVLAESFDVAWRRVGLALDRTGFTVEDRDRSKGVYFVRYVDTTKEEKGFFAGLFSSAPADAGPLKYRVMVSNAAGKSEIQVLNNQGNADNSAISQRILKLIGDELR
ncbi:MAG: outer membrane protein assembly factor BamC [Pseudomonadota bacterium]